MLSIENVFKMLWIFFYEIFCKFQKRPLTQVNENSCEQMFDVRGVTTAESRLNTK